MGKMVEDIVRIEICINTTNTEGERLNEQRKNKEAN